MTLLNQLYFPYPIKQQVYWGEMDAFGHINNVSYFRYFETGRITLFNETGFWQALQDEKVRIVIVKLECNYVREIVYPQEIEIAVAIKEIGNSSLKVHHIVRDANDKNIIFAHGEGIIVGTDPKTGKSTAWNNVLREKLNRFKSKI
jgi:acyl-CoA thioester hydrolase